MKYYYIRNHSVKVTECLEAYFEVEPDNDHFTVYIRWQGIGWKNDKDWSYSARRYNEWSVFVANPRNTVEEITVEHWNEVTLQHKGDKS